MGVKEARLSVWSDSKIHGVHGCMWTGCRSLDVWGLDRRPSVSEPSPFKGNLQHGKGTG